MRADHKKRQITIRNEQELNKMCFFLQNPTAFPPFSMDFFFKWKKYRGWDIKSHKQQ